MDVALKTSWEGWTVMNSGERESGRTVLAAWHDDDDDDDDFTNYSEKTFCRYLFIYLFIYIFISIDLILGHFSYYIKIFLVLTSAESWKIWIPQISSLYHERHF